MAAICLLLSPNCRAESDEALAKRLQNPVADLVSVPIQCNYDHGYGTGDKGERWVANIQPVIPVGINDDWNLISRTILPIVSQHDIFSDSGTQAGLGDITQSFFLSPKQPTKGGWIWGAGPVFLLPTGTDTLLSSRKWGVGPTGVALGQDGPWTYGALVNHVWSVAGDADRSGVSSTFLQPFLSYTTHDAWTLALNSESTYDWKASEWSAPLNFTVSKLTSFGDQKVSLGLGTRYWMKTPDSGPEGFGVRFTITFLFPE